MSFDLKKEKILYKELTIGELREKKLKELFGGIAPSSYSRCKICDKGISYHGKDKFGIVYCIK